MTFFSSTPRFRSPRLTTLLLCIAASLASGSTCFGELRILEPGDDDPSALVRTDIAASPERPVALVIGNSAYRYVGEDPSAITTRSPLSSGSRDAEAVASSLLDLGFDVAKGIDVDWAEFAALVVAFHRDSRGGSAALFYYSGHAGTGRHIETGRDVDGLYPVDTQGGAGLDIEDVLAGMGADVNLVFLDAILSDALRIKRPNMLIAYAGNPARAVGPGELMGAFTRAFLDAVAPDVDIVDVVQEIVRNVPRNVRRELDIVPVRTAVQQPWMESSLRQPYLLPNLSRLLAHKLDTRLAGLVALAAADGIGAIPTAACLACDSTVAVRILADSEVMVDAVAALVVSVGGEVQSTFENNVFASLGVGAIVNLAFSANVFRIDLDEATVAPLGQGAPPTPEARVDQRDSVSREGALD